MAFIYIDCIQIVGYYMQKKYFGSQVVHYFMKNRQRDKIYYSIMSRIRDNLVITFVLG